MLLALSLFACDASIEDSTGDVDSTCAFGPTVRIDSPADGASFVAGDAVSLSATASSANTDTQYLQIVWGSEALTGVDAGAQDTVGVGATVSWIAPSAGDWRLIVQVDDDCTSDPAYATPPAQAYVDVVVQ